MGPLARRPIKVRSGMVALPEPECRAAAHRSDGFVRLHMVDQLYGDASDFLLSLTIVL